MSASFRLLRALFFVAACIFIAGCEERVPESSTESADEVYTCAMHPEIREHTPGDCPICGMALVELRAGSESTEGEGPNSVHLSERAQAQAQVRTARVTQQQSAPSARSYTGRISADESREHVLTSWVGGRLERLLVRTEGTEVRRGQSLARVYSPEVYAAAGELRVALRQQERLSGQDPVFVRSAEQNVEAARQRLRLLGIRGAALTRLEANAVRSVSIHAAYSGTVVERLAEEGQQLEVGSPLLRIVDLTSVWALVELPEAEAAGVRPGQRVRIFIDGEPRILEGEVDFVERTLRTRGRVDVRVVLPNEDGSLRPGMTLRAELQSGGDDAPRLTIPVSAPLFTGETSVVYVASPSEGGRRFSMREVTLGPRLGGALDGEYVVLTGLDAGEEIAVHGAFMIDAELSLRGGAGMMGERLPVAPSFTDASLNATLGPVFSSFLDLSEALAADDTGAATLAGDAFYQALEGVETSMEAGDRLWRQHEADLRESAMAAMAAGDLAAWRRQLPSLEAHMSALLRVVPNPTDAPIRRAHCPMAEGDEGQDGAYWLQREESIQNAYFGASMLRCGSIEATTLPGARAE
ncbi:MAG: efflux RND transporter periplasmic adaptor subunit [Polyangiales bacterium]